MNYNLKYNNRLELIKKEYEIDCPCKEAASIDSIIYRWVYEDIKHEFNFLPVRIIAERQGRHPRRFPPSRIENNCNQFALSMYETEEQGRSYFYNLNSRIRKKLGYTHIAQGQVDNNDGLANPSDEQGHFGFHEYEKIKLVNKFEIINPL